MISEEELKCKYSMMTDTWRLYKQFADVKGNDEYWERLIDESNAVSKKYGECKFIIDLVSAVITELERMEMGENSG